MNNTTQPLLRLLRVCILVVLAAWLLQIVLLSLQWRMTTDQPIMFYLGWLMDRFGSMPYRDFFEMNPPGTPLLYALLGRLTGFSDPLIRWVDLLAFLLLSRMTLAWMRPFGRGAAALGILSFGFIYFGYGPYMSLQREYLLLLPIAAAVLVATAGGRLGLAARAMIAGFCFGAAATVKPHSALGLLPVLIYLLRSRDCRRPRPQSDKKHALAILASAAAGFALPPLLVALWLYHGGALHPFLEVVRRYWPLYQDLNAGLQILPPEERSAYFNYFMRGLDGHSPWMILALAGTYTALIRTQPRTERRDRLGLLLQLAGCYALYVLLGGKFWHYHFLPLFYFIAQLGGLCFMAPPAGTAPRQDWFLTWTVVLGLFLSLAVPTEYLIQLQGYPPPAPKGGRPDAIARYLTGNMNPGDLVQPLDVTGGAVHAMLLAGAPLATPFIYDFHFYHHIYSDYTRELRQRFIDAMVRARPRFVIQVQTDKPWVSGVETTTTFAELSDLLRRDYAVDYQNYGVSIYKRTSGVARGSDPTSGSHTLRIIVKMPRRPQPRPTPAPPEFDVVVYGGTSAGVTAAVAAARLGRRVALVEPGWHLGGMTSGGLGATDLGKPDTIGGIAREFYRRVKLHYANPAAWKWEKPADYKSFWHDPAADVMWSFEPLVAENILTALAREAGVRVVYGERLDLRGGVRKNAARIERIVMESGREFSGRVFIDATYEGDLMAKAGVAYHVGREANSVYGETMNGVQTRRVPYNGHNFFRPVSPYLIPGNPKSGLIYGVQPEPPGADGSGDRRVQAYCYRLCLTEVPQNRVPFPKPEGYDPAQYELLLRYLLTEGTGRFFPDHPQPKAIESPALGYDPYKVVMPNRKTDSNTKGAVSFNFVGGNYDYPDGDYATRERIAAGHRRWQQGLLWFVQNDPRVPAAYREPLRGWGLAKDEFTDTGHWPHQLYVREARRMIGEYVMTEADCAGRRRAADLAGLGSYGMDSHVTQRYVDASGWVRNEGNIGGSVPRPYPISYRALIPRRAECENLLVPVCVSATHAAYGSIRMEPVYMILGQSAGAAAVLSIDQNVPVQDLNYTQLCERLTTDGQKLD